jgi:hypothetical protein
MTAEKKITITISEEVTQTGNPVFAFKATNLKRYEAIGLLTLAIENLKKDSIKETTEINN